MDLMSTFFLEHILGQREASSMNNSIWQQNSILLQLKIWDENWQDGFSIFLLELQQKSFSVSLFRNYGLQLQLVINISAYLRISFSSTADAEPLHIAKSTSAPSSKKGGTRLGLKWSRIITSPQQKSDYKNATFFPKVQFLSKNSKPYVYKLY